MRALIFEVEEVHAGDDESFPALSIADNIYPRHI
jgi:hypothetical protein